MQPEFRSHLHPAQLHPAHGTGPGPPDGHSRWRVAPLRSEEHPSSLHAVVDFHTAVVCRAPEDVLLSVGAHHDLLDGRAGAISSLWYALFGMLSVMMLQSLQGSAGPRQLC